MQSLMILSCLTFEVIIHFQFTENITASLMHSTYAKMAVCGITPYTLTANSKRKLAFLFSILTTNNHFLAQFTENPLSVFQVLSA